MLSHDKHLTKPRVSPTLSWRSSATTKQTTYDGPPNIARTTKRATSGKFSVFQKHCVSHCERRTNHTTRHNAKSGRSNQEPSAEQSYQVAHMAGTLPTHPKRRHDMGFNHQQRRFDRM